MKPNAYFVSDLHLFCERSVADQHLPRLRELAADAHTFVLGGDIFDFKWSTLKSIAATAHQARLWLEELVCSFADCCFHYVLGNHDCSPQLIKELKRLAKKVSNFFWHPYTLRKGNTVFLHGDVTHDMTTHSQLEANRAKWSMKQPRRGFANMVYNGAVAMNVHGKIANAINRPQRVAERLLYYLDDVGQGVDSGVEQVYFGHTHSQLIGYQYRGVEFHNGGAPIKGLPFKFVPITSSI